ncbi:MAG: phosphopyruvate hydratase [Nanobdellota archaeon]
MTRMVKIKKVHARQVLDSRGNPTVEAEVTLTTGFGKAIVPSGASTGIHEALELRDGNKAYHGKSVQKAIRNINTTILKAIVGKEFKTLKELDTFLIELDGTTQKARLGENAILAVSMAFARAHADSKKMPLYKYLAGIISTKKSLLPVPFANVINGGVHAGNKLEMQEFMIVPYKAPNFSKAVQMVVETYHELKTIIAKKYGKDATSVGDEGGFAPPVEDAREALKILSLAVKKAGYDGKIAFAMDPASSEFYNKDGTYTSKKWTAEKLKAYYGKLSRDYRLISLEDPFEQDDFEAWKRFTAAYADKFQIVGDDLTVTNPARVQLAVDQKLCNALLLKINQIGSITESLEAARVAKEAGWKVMVSHRSGETEDDFIADLSVALGSGQIKLGAPCRSDRIAKYNRLLRIEEELGKQALYARWK